MNNRNSITCFAALLVMMIPYLTYAQLTFQEINIDTEFLVPATTALIDLDNDADLDLICGGETGLSWWTQVEPSVWESHIIDTEYTNLISVIPYNIDQDIHMDFVGLSYNEGDINQLVIYEQRDNLEWNIVSIDLGDLNPIIFTVDDFNQDGELDLVIATDGEESNIYLVEEREPGVWASQLINENYASINSLMSYDIDRDEDIDIIASSSGSNTIFCLEQSEEDQWIEHVIDDNIQIPGTLLITDIDGDAEDELLASSFSGNFISFYDMEDLDTWTRNLIIDNFFNPTELKSADFDQDGDYDLIAYGQMFGEIAWFSQEAEGVWITNQVAENYLNVASFILGDVNHDDRPDFVTTVDAMNVISWWENVENKRPEPFDLLQPEDQDTTWGLETELSWNETTDEDGIPAYDVWMGNLPDLSDAVLIGDSVLTPTLAIDDLFADIFYYWTVRATDDNTEGTWANDTLCFSTYMLNPPDPEPFRLFRPANGAVLWQLTTTLLWFPSTDPDGTTPNYDLWIGNEADMSDAVLVADSIDVASRTINVRNNMTYYWSVRATDNNTRGTWAEEVFSFSVDINAIPDPEPFSLLSPEDGEIVWFSDIDLEWEDTTDPDGTEPSYNVYLATRDNLNNAVLVADSIAENSLRVYGLNNHTTYYWTVYANDDNSEGTWANDTLSFRVNTETGPRPAAFSLLTPSNQDTVWELSTTLGWENTTDPDDTTPHYDLWIGTHPDSLNTLLADSMETNEFAIQDLSDDTEYFWNVRATDDNTMGNWANELFSFRTYLPEPPLAFDLLGPEDEYIISGEDDFPLIFTWDGAEDPDPNDVLRYQLVLSTDPDFATDSTVYNANISELFVVYSLEADEYWWRVWVTDNYGFVVGSTNTYSLDAASSVNGFDFDIPQKYSIVSAYPNPFNPSMNLVIGLPEASQLELRVFNLLGQQVALITNQTYNQGYHKFRLDGSQLSSGTYLVKAYVPNKLNAQQRVFLLK